MPLFLRSLAMVFLAGLLVACGEDLSSDDHLENAKALVQKHEYPAAIIELKNALQKDVSNTRARIQLGRIYFRFGDFASAEKEFSKAIDVGVDPSTIAPDYAKTLLSLGEYSRLDRLSVKGLTPHGRSEVLAAQGLSQLYQGEMIRAQEFMDTALENKPVAVYASVAAARLLMANGDYPKARKQLNVVFEKNPKYAPAWNLLGDIEAAKGHPKKAEQAYTKVIEYSSYHFDAQLNRAMMRIYQNNFAGAREDLGILNSRYGGIARAHPGVHFARGLVQLQGKNLVEARKSFEKASEYSDTYPLTYYYLAAIDLESGSSEQALASIYRFLNLVPGSVVGAKLAARLELEQRSFDRAAALLQPVVAARPDDIDALNLLASAMLGQGKSGEGVELLARVSELQPESAEARARLGAGFLAVGEEEIGIATLRAILDNDPTYEQADILIVLNFLRQNDIEEALFSAKAYRDRNPGSTTSYNLLGRTYLAAGETEQARAAFEKVLELREGDPGACHGLAEFEMANRNFAGARSYYEQVLKQDPGHMSTLMKIAASYAVEGREEEMFESLRRTMVAHPRAMEPRLVKARYYIAKGQLENAGSAFDQLTPEQKESPEALATLASFELAAGRHNQAIITLDKLIKLRPDVSQYHYLKSKAYAGIGNMDKFAEELEKAVELDPDHFFAKIALARLELLVGQMDKFEQSLAELKEIAPDNLDVLKLEVALAQKTGDTEYAHQLLQSLYEQSPDVGNLLALARQRYTVGDTEGAISLLEDWVKKNPGSIVAREQLAQYYGEQDKVDRVVAQYRVILGMNEDNLVALNNISWYLRDSSPRESLAFAEKAFALSPESASVLDTLAMAQLSNFHFVAARRTIDRALVLAPDVPELRFHDAQIAAGQGNNKRAREIVTALLAEHQEFSERAEAEAFLQKLP